MDFSLNPASNKLTKSAKLNPSNLNYYDPPIVLPVEGEVEPRREAVPQGRRVVHRRGGRGRAPGKAEQVVELSLHPPPEAGQLVLVGEHPWQNLELGREGGRAREGQGGEGDI